MVRARRMLEGEREGVDEQETEPATGVGRKPGAATIIGFGFGQCPPAKMLAWLGINKVTLWSLYSLS